MTETREQILFQIKNANKLSAQPKILAVSKFQTTEKIRSLANQGQKLFAENYVQEALPKQSELKDLHLEWHFIGRLQKNKAKDVVGHFHLLHSIDSLELAQGIDKQAAQKALTQKLLLQVNLSGETTKGGFDENSLQKQISELQTLRSIEICGLMTMPPLFENPEEARPFFQRLRTLRDQIQKSIPNCQELSMGTSSDYLVAAEEGATIVRLGTILFGERTR